MARFLVLYGTTDGHTRKIADALAAQIRREGDAADVIDARDAGADVRPQAYEGVVVAASIHVQGYQRAVRRWVRRHAEQLNSRPSAFVSVCLAILEQRPEARQAVADIMDRFLRASGWRPAITKTVAGALPYTRYGWLKKRIMRHIAAKAGTVTDPTRDYEFTDWAEVAAVARDLVDRVESRAPGYPHPAAAAPFRPSGDVAAPDGRSPALARR